jgi:hypothetical protein
MKNLLTISFLALLASCGGKESESQEPVNILENLTYSVDTVVVDAGDDFFNLGSGIRSLDLSEDGKRLFYFENKPLKLVEIDLENRKLIGKTEFEQEGPNGIGSFVGNIKIGPNDQLYAMGITEVGLFDKSGTKLENLKILPTGIEANLAKDFITLYANASYDFNKKQFYSWPISEVTAGSNLYQIDVASKTAEMIPAPELGIVEKYSLTASENGNTMFYPQEVHIILHEDQVVISCTAMSSIYKFDRELNSMKFIAINHLIVPNSLTGEINNNVSSLKAFKEEIKKARSQISFMELEWDSTRDMFLRLGVKTFMGENRGDPSTYEFYLFAYDKDFNVLGETKLGKLEPEPRSYFWKDGKLWSYVNVEDELGFAVFTFNF